MKFSYKMMLGGLMALAIGQGAFAQEAVGSADVSNQSQQTWNALVDKIRSVNTKFSLLDMQIKQLKACGNSGKIYAPGVSGGDGTGCIAAVPANEADIVKLMECNSMKKFLVDGNCEGLTAEPVTVLKHVIQEDDDKMPMFETH